MKPQVIRGHDGQLIIEQPENMQKDCPCLVIHACQDAIRLQIGLDWRNAAELNGWLGLWLSHNEEPEDSTRRR